MAYVELYNNDILDMVSLGKTINEFDENMGDYIKVEVFSRGFTSLQGTLYSNRILLKPSDEPTNKYYIGDYHFHPENPEMGFCTGAEHTEESITGLLPQPLGELMTNNEPLNENIQFKKQIDIFKDDNDQIYIKPNEIIKLISNERGPYGLRIHFLRNIKCELGSFLNLMKNNLIENGNFFSGLEATQTGDLDRSVGKNNFLIIENPGLSPFVLQQNGLPGNEYSMKVTGIEPSSSYVFSCWVAWDDDFNGDSGIVSFKDASSEGGPVGLPTIPKTDLRGSYLDDEGEDRILKTKDFNAIRWYRLYSFVQTDENADLGSITIRLGYNFGDFSPSTEPLGNRYFTDLRFEKVDSLIGSPIQEYLKKLEVE